MFIFDGLSTEVHCVKVLPGHSTPIQRRMLSLAILRGGSGVKRVNEAPAEPVSADKIGVSRTTSLYLCTCSSLRPKDDDKLAKINWQSEPQRLLALAAGLEVAFRRSANQTRVASERRLLLSCLLPVILSNADGLGDGRLTFCLKWAKDCIVMMLDYRFETRS